MVFAWIGDVGTVFLDCVAHGLAGVGIAAAGAVRFKLSQASLSSPNAGLHAPLLSMPSAPSSHSRPFPHMSLTMAVVQAFDLSQAVWQPATHEAIEE